MPGKPTLERNENGEESIKPNDDSNENFRDLTRHLLKVSKQEVKEMEIKHEKTHKLKQLGSLVSCALDSPSRPCGRNP